MIKKHIMGLLFLSFMTLLLPACAVQENPALKDGYQLGDGTKVVAGEALNLLLLRYRYCHTYSPEAREVILEVIQVLHPDYPTEGICTDMGELIEQLKNTPPDNE